MKSLRLVIFLILSLSMAAFAKGGNNGGGTGFFSGQDTLYDSSENSNIPPYWIPIEELNSWTPEQAVRHCLANPDSAICEEEVIQELINSR
jgi:hypothetical protein